MGNSGSHQHHHSQHQQTHNHQNGGPIFHDRIHVGSHHGGLKWTHSLEGPQHKNRIKKGYFQHRPYVGPPGNGVPLPQKVLPTANVNPVQAAKLLKPTNNGAILHGGGTISGRKILISQQEDHEMGRKRSNSINGTLDDNHHHYLGGKRASGFSTPDLYRVEDCGCLEEDCCVEGIGCNGRDYDSEPELLNGPPVTVSDQRSPSPNTFTLLSESPAKKQIRSKKKSKAPPPPVLVPGCSECEQQSRMSNGYPIPLAGKKKLNRLFKTKAESSGISGRPMRNGDIQCTDECCILNVANNQHRDLGKAGRSRDLAIEASSKKSKLRHIASTPGRISDHGEGKWEDIPRLNKIENAPMSRKKQHPAPPPPVVNSKPSKSHEVSESGSCSSKGSKARRSPQVVSNLTEAKMNMPKSNNIVKPKTSVAHTKSSDSHSKDLTTSNSNVCNPPKVTDIKLKKEVIPTVEPQKFSTSLADDKKTFYFGMHAGTFRAKQKEEEEKDSHVVASSPSTSNMTVKPTLKPITQKLRTGHVKSEIMISSNIHDELATKLGKRSRIIEEHMNNQSESAITKESTSYSKHDNKENRSEKITIAETKSSQVKPEVKGGIGEAMIHLRQDSGSYDVEERREREELLKSQKLSGVVRESSSDLSSSDVDIPLMLKPTLPQKRRDLPRFSPGAAWRALESPRVSDQSLSSEETAAMFRESGRRDSIVARHSRPSAPLPVSAERSGDSGISAGDGGPSPANNDDMLLENHLMESAKTGTSSSKNCWTPQQDLDESSSEFEHDGYDHPDASPTQVGSGRNGRLPIGLRTPPKFTTRSNLFDKKNGTLSEVESSAQSYRKYPRSHGSHVDISSSEEEEPEDVNAINKAKIFNKGNSFHAREINGSPKSPSTMLGGLDGNWFLSRSEPNSLNVLHLVEFNGGDLEKDTYSNQEANHQYMTDSLSFDNHHVFFDEWIKEKKSQGRSCDIGYGPSSMNFSENSTKSKNIVKTIIHANDGHIKRNGKSNNQIGRPFTSKNNLPGWQIAEEQIDNDFEDCLDDVGSENNPYIAGSVRNGPFTRIVYLPSYDSRRLTSRGANQFGNEARRAKSVDALDSSDFPLFHKYESTNEQFLERERSRETTAVKAKRSSFRQKSRRDSPSPERSSRRSGRGRQSSRRYKNERNSAINNVRPNHNDTEDLGYKRSQSVPLYSYDEPELIPQVGEERKANPGLKETFKQRSDESERNGRKKFKYQSTLRVQERKKIEEELAREVEERELQRLREIEQMKKVEEEFQKKRAKQEKEMKEKKAQQFLFNHPIISSTKEKVQLSTGVKGSEVGPRRKNTEYNSSKFRNGQREEPEGAPSTTTDLRKELIHASKKGNGVLWSGNSAGSIISSTTTFSVTRGLSPHDKIGLGEHRNHARSSSSPSKSSQASLKGGRGVLNDHHSIAKTYELSEFKQPDKNPKYCDYRKSSKHLLSSSPARYRPSSTSSDIFPVPGSTASGRSSRGGGKRSSSSSLFGKSHHRLFAPFPPRARSSSSTTNSTTSAHSHKTNTVYPEVVCDIPVKPFPYMVNFSSRMTGSSSNIPLQLENLEEDRPIKSGSTSSIISCENYRRDWARHASRIGGAESHRTGSGRASSVTSLHSVPAFRSSSELGRPSSAGDLLSERPESRDGMGKRSSSSKNPLFYKSSSSPPSSPMPPISVACSSSNTSSCAELEKDGGRKLGIELKEEDEEEEERVIVISPPISTEDERSSSAASSFHPHPYHLENFQKMAYNPMNNGRPVISKLSTTTAVN